MLDCSLYRTKNGSAAKIGKDSDKPLTIGPPIKDYQRKGIQTQLGIGILLEWKWRGLTEQTAVVRGSCEDAGNHEYGERGGAVWPLSHLF